MDETESSAQNTQQVEECSTDEPTAKKIKLDNKSTDSAPSTAEKKPTTQKTKSQGLLKEVDVGITTYITKGFDPIQGVLKQRFSDFVVNEIDTNGEIVRLTSTSTVGCNGSSDKKESQKSEGADNCPIPAPSLSELKSIVDEGDKEKSVRMLAPLEKDERRKIHMYIKSHYPAVNSNCVEVEGAKYLEFFLSSNSKMADNRSKSWPKDRPQHLIFTLYKEFKDTAEAIDVISKYSGIKPQQFNMAGTKDRRAKTSQRISLFKVDAEKLQKVNKKLHGMSMGNFKYSKEKITLGQLSGNHFKIVMRNVDTTPENLLNATESLRDVGFINYFGMQRFGTTSIPTYQIGLHILKGELESAVDLVMACRDSDKPHVAETKLLWKEKRDAAEVLKKLPRSFNIERRLMQGVVKHGVGKLRAALGEIPRTTRLLYLHSYQSFIWNRVASLRVDKYGLVPMVGDLVYVKDAAIAATADDANSTASIENQSAEVIDKDAAGTDRDAVTESRNKAAVKRLTADDLEKHTIYDVVLPQPGYSIMLPDNEMGELITKILADDNLTLSSLKGTGKLREYGLPGSYRHLLVRPDNLSSSLAHYDDVTEELVQSDLDILNNKVLSKKESGKFKAAILEFSLPSSSYATMLFREVMRIDTSAAHQTSLNQT